jgi:hypothetical protein
MCPPPKMCGPQRILGTSSCDHLFPGASSLAYAATHGLSTGHDEENKRSDWVSATMRGLFPQESCRRTPVAPCPHGSGPAPPRAVMRSDRCRADTTSPPPRRRASSQPSVRRFSYMLSALNELDWLDVCCQSGQCGGCGQIWFASATSAGQPGPGVSHGWGWGYDAVSC